MSNFQLVTAKERVSAEEAAEQAKAMRKAIRRQAALAGFEGKRTSGQGTSVFRQMNSRKIQHIVFSLPPNAHTSRHGTRKDRRSIKVEEEQAAASQLASPRVLHIGSRQLDPFGTFSVDFAADPQLHTAYRTLSERLGLMDLRLPIHQDRGPAGRRSLGRHYAQQAFECEPLFWSLVHNSAGLTIARHGQDPNETAFILRLRNNAIRGINDELTRLKDTDPLTVGLVCAIATLGIWERQWGTEEAWYAHRTGMELLARRVLANQSQHYLLGQIMPIVNALKPGPVDPLSPLDSDTGFARVAAPANLNAPLVRWLRCCADRNLQGDSRRLHEIATGILAYRNVNSLAHLILRLNFRSTESDMMFFKMHIIMQAAGIAMVHHLQETEETAFGDIDFEHVPGYATTLAKEVIADHTYDEILLWALFTICALLEHSETASLRLMSTLCERQQLSALAELQSLLSQFALVESAQPFYHRTWSAIMPLNRSPSTEGPEHDG